MTAAHNEEEHIASTIEAVSAQSIRPARWAIVSDNSHDGTDELILHYASTLPFIAYRRISRQEGRSFASKVYALRLAYEILCDVDYQYIGNLDADVTLPTNYFELLMARCEVDPSLGIASGAIYEQNEGAFCSRRLNSESSVAHAAQLLRRDCYFAIGGYSVLKYGGEDWHAQVCAEMRGWQAKTFLEIPVYHHRPTGSAGGYLRSCFRQGKMDYAFGSSSLFESVKCLRRLGGQPPFVGGLLRFMGFLQSALTREGRQVDQDFVLFLQSQQRARLHSHLTQVGLRLRKLVSMMIPARLKRHTPSPALKEYSARPNVSRRGLGNTPRRD